MKRFKLLVKAPGLSQSGYGEQSRFALRSLRKHSDKFEIFFLNLNWRKNAVGSFGDDEEKNYLEELLIKTQNYYAQHQQTNQTPVFDCSLQITIPNEFENMAPVNIRLYCSG